MVVERNAHALLAAEHLAGHERVEDPRAGQREAEVEAKEPPVLHFLIKLQPRKKKLKAVRSTSAIQEARLRRTCQTLCHSSGALDGN